MGKAISEARTANALQHYYKNQEVATRDISDTVIGWDTIVQKIIAKHHTEKIARRSGLVSQDATSRYLDFMEKFPGLSLINRIPLSYIASYLGITQSSLSRIRKNTP